MSNNTTKIVALFIFWFAMVVIGNLIWNPVTENTRAVIATSFFVMAGFVSAHILNALLERWK
jgi:O-antigen ligase